MTEKAWTRVDPSTLQGPRTESVRGVAVTVQISPYDLPRFFRGYYDKDRGEFRIEFRYADDEPGESRSVDTVFTVEVGKHSGKVLAIRLAVDAHQLDVVRLKIEQASEIVDRLRLNESRPNAHLNYDAVGQVLRDRTKDLVPA